MIQRWQQLFKCDFFVFEINVYMYQRWVHPPSLVHTFRELLSLISRNREMPVDESAPITRALRTWVACYKHSVGKTELNYKQQDCSSRVNITEVWVGSCTPSSIFFHSSVTITQFTIFVLDLANWTLLELLLEWKISPDGIF